MKKRLINAYKLNEAKNHYFFIHFYFTKHRFIIITKEQPKKQTRLQNYMNKKKKKKEKNPESKLENL